MFIYFLRDDRPVEHTYSVVVEYEAECEYLQCVKQEIVHANPQHLHLLNKVTAQPALVRMPGVREQS